MHQNNLKITKKIQIFFYIYRRDAIDGGLHEFC
jgi:hypothetical protein